MDRPPLLSQESPSPPCTAPPSRAALESLSPLAVCAQRQSSVLPPVVPEALEPPAYASFCDQRCHNSRASCAAWLHRGNISSLPVETAPFQTQYVVAGGTLERSVPSSETTPPTFTTNAGLESSGNSRLAIDAGRTSRARKSDADRPSRGRTSRACDDAARHAGRKSVTFRPPSNIPVTQREQIADSSILPIRSVSRESRSRNSRAIRDSEISSIEKSISGSSAPFKGMYRASCSSKLSVDTWGSREQRGLFRHHYLEEALAEGTGNSKHAGRCSLTNLVARFKDSGGGKFEERTVDVVDFASTEPRSALLHLRDEDGEMCESIHFSRFVQPNYVQVGSSSKKRHPFAALHSDGSIGSLMGHMRTRKSAASRRSSVKKSTKARLERFLKFVFLCTYEKITSLLIEAARPRKLATFCASLLILCTFSFILFVVVGGNYFGRKFLFLEDPALRGDPGYLVDFFGGKCVYLKERFGEELRQLESFNFRLGWRAVSFQARDGRLISALWLPSPIPQSPRVVIAHSGLSNYLESAVQTAAYYLRSMNISVLAPNLRHHGGYGLLGRQVLKWQNQDLDILGAWDYAVNDPDGLLGGSLADHFVGLMGFDFGALGVQMAYGLEPRVQSMFLDGAVHNVRQLLSQKLKRRLTSWIFWMFDEQAWTEWKYLVHRDLDKDLSASIVKERTAPGFVAVTHCKQDIFVPFGQSELLVEQLSDSIDVDLMKWYPEFGGPDTCKSKSESYMEHPREYKAFLCAFWSRAFGEFEGGNAISPRCRAFGSSPSISN